jgi:hypothetical protein
MTRRPVAAMTRAGPNASEPGSKDPGSLPWGGSLCGGRYGARANIPLP